RDRLPFFCSFFFSSRRRHTRFSRDWSSDVCSSDLTGRKRRRTDWSAAAAALPGARRRALSKEPPQPQLARLVQSPPEGEQWLHEDRKSVRVGKECRSRWTPRHPQNRAAYRSSSVQR